MAASWLQRLRGLLFYSPLSADEGLWLTPCRSIHTVGMRYALDVVFVDRSRVVRAVHANVRPVRACAGPRAKLDTLELPAGRIRQTGLSVGDELCLGDPVAVPDGALPGRQT